MIYDPERALWMPNRRKFFLMGLAAGIAPFLPDLPPINVLPPRKDWAEISVTYESFGGRSKITQVFFGGERVPGAYPIHIPTGYIAGLTITPDGRLEIIPGPGNVFTLQG